MITVWVACAELHQVTRHILSNKRISAISRNAVNVLRNGIVTTCAICRSEFHWARECPNNFKNRRNFDQNKSKQSDEVFIGGVFEESNDWAEVEAILDTGCNNSVIGEI